MNLARIPRLHTLALAAVLLSTAHAAPDTHVSNTVNFSTDVIYQVVTDRFVDGNTANNPTGAAFSPGCTQLKLYCGGDWQGLINKINDNYFTTMGITALWISQPVENIFAVINYSGTNSTSYHGYWARDFKRPNGAFGTVTDFQNLVTAAHAKGIKVIIDFAPNHTSPASQTDASFAENGRLYDNGALMSGYTTDPSGYFHHNGGTTFSNLEDGIYRNLFDLADLDHNKAPIDLYLKQAIKGWLDLGVDGIRMDAVKHMPKGWQKNFMADIYAYKPVFTFGEWFLSENENDPAYYDFANSAGMSQLDFVLGQRVRQVFRNGTHSMLDLDATLDSTQTAYKQPADQVTFMDNHDMDRFQVTGASGRKLEQALAFILTSRGVPNIYYGTEQYMAGNGDPSNRARIGTFNTTNTAFKVVQALAPLRKSNPAFSYGDTVERWKNNDVYIYERKFNGATGLVAINRNLSSSASISGLLTALPNGTYTDKLAGLLNGNSITVSAGAVPTFTLAAGAVAVWEYKPATYSVARIGQVGPMIGKAGNTISISGRGFGATKGTVTFGTTVVSGTNITQWEDTLIKVKVPAATPGLMGVSVTRSGSTTPSNTYANFELLTGNQVSVRFVVNNASTVLGENVFLSGSVSELSNWSATNPVGACFNQVMHAYPSWYCDVNVPASTALQFKFIKKNGASVVWEGGSNHTFTTPASGTGKVIVNWQP